MQNNGEERWPDGCFLKQTYPTEGSIIPVQPINPGETCILTAQLTSPSELGSFQTKWRLYTAIGTHFGGNNIFVLFLF